MSYMQCAHHMQKSYKMRMHCSSPTTYLSATLFLVPPPPPPNPLFCMFVVKLMCFAGMQLQPEVPCWHLCVVVQQVTTSQFGGNTTWRRLTRQQSPSLFPFQGSPIHSPYVLSLLLWLKRKRVCVPRIGTDIILQLLDLRQGLKALNQPHTTHYLLTKESSYIPVG